VLRPLGSSVRNLSTDDKTDPFDNPPAGFESEYIVPVEGEEEVKRELEAKQGHLTFKDIVAKYGFYPLVGLGTAAAFSKEFIFLNEEFLLLINWAIFCATVYIGVGNKAWEAYLDIVNKAKRTQHDWDQLKIDLIDQGIKEKELSLSTPEIYREYQNEFQRGCQGIHGLRARPTAPRVARRDPEAIAGVQGH
jgi:hypothetical protein